MARTGHGKPAAGIMGSEVCRVKKRSRGGKVLAAAALALAWGCSGFGESGRKESPQLVIGEMVFRRISPKAYGSPGPDFYLLETEVTNEQYLGFLLSTGGTKDDSPPQEPEDSPVKEARRKGYETESPFVFQIDRPKSLWKENRPPPGGGDLPVSLIRVKDAREFCAWLNSRYGNAGAFRLPTRDEWLLAAYGAGRPCPWGAPTAVAVRPAATCGPEPVRQRPESRTPEGLYGMWGNVGEFVQPGPAKLPGLPYRQEVLWVGGSYADPEPSALQDFWGSWIDPNGRSQHVGFRVLLEPSDSVLHDPKAGERR